MGIFSRITAALIAGVALIPAASAGFDSSTWNNVVVYWGQNSYGAGTGPLAQQRLSYYCQNAKIDIIPLAFLTNMANPDSLNFANRSPTELANDIKECQQTYKKTIVLSLGGAVSQGNGFASPSDAVQKAQQLWAAFGPPSSASSNRKFGNAVIDGFDFDNEQPLSNLIPFARELRRLMTESSKRDGKKYLLTAAPQCPFPDANVGPLLSSDVNFDAVFVQFYNNPGCGVNAFVSGVDKQPGFNFETWQNWAKGSKNPGVKVMVGVPATPNAAGSGYISGDKLAEILAYCKKFTNFGGVMFWDMSQIYSAPDILNKARAALGGSTSPVSQTVKPSSTTTTRSTSKFTTKSTPQPAPTTFTPKNPSTMVTKIKEVTPSPLPPRVRQWNQCAGKDWNGGRVCEEPYICKYFSVWYSQCE